VAELNRAWRVLRSVCTLTVPAAAQILDAGCGQGTYSLWLSHRFPEGSVVSVDEDQRSLDDLRLLVARERRRNITVAALKLEQLEVREAYDLIVCVDVIEHISDDVRAVTNLRRALKPRGRLILHVPQRGQRHQFLRRSFGPGHHHCREGYAPEELVQLVRRSGLTPVSLEQSFGSLATLSCEIDELLWTSRLYPAWLAVYPLLLAVMWWDVRRPVRHGHGLLAVAER